MGAYGDFVKAAWAMAWKDGRAFVGKPVGRIVGPLWVAAFSGLGLAYAEPAISGLGIQLSADETLKGVVKAALGLLTSGGFALLLIVGSAIFYAPYKLWRREQLRAAAFPYGAAEPLFEVVDFWTGQPPGLPPFREAATNLKLKRDVTDAQIKVWGYHSAAQPKLVETIAVPKGYQGDVIKVVLATAGVREGGQHFGQRKDETFPENTPLLVRIEMLVGAERQERRFQVISLDTRDQRLLQALDATWNPYFWPDLNLKLPG